MKNRDLKEIDSGSESNVKKKGAVIKSDSITGDLKGQSSQNSRGKSSSDEVDDLRLRIEHLQNTSTNLSARVLFSLIIKRAFAVVPILDGKNLFKFIKACNRLESQIPKHAQADAVTLLKTKIII